MKKIMAIIIGLLVCTMVVLASGPRNQEQIVGGDSDKYGCKGSAGYSWCESKGRCIRVFETTCQEPGQEQSALLEQNNASKEVSERGLMNALLRVRNQQSLQVLERNLEKISNKTLNKLAGLDNIIVDEDENGNYIISANGEAKFFGFNFDKRFRYQLNDDGSITYRHRWYDFIITFEDLTDQEEATQ